jgi:hypothetical protein
VASVSRASTVFELFVGDAFYLMTSNDRARLQRRTRTQRASTLQACCRLVDERSDDTARKLYRTRDEAKADVFGYIERFYNPSKTQALEDRL